MEKNPNTGCSLRKFQRRGEFYCASVLDKSKMMRKKGSMRLWEQICLLSLFQSLHRNKSKAAVGAVCAVANCFPNCQSRRKDTLVNFEGLSQDGGRAELT